VSIDFDGPASFSAPSEVVSPLNSLGQGEPGALMVVSGWRSMGWIRHHLSSSDSVLRVELGPCRTVSDAVFVIGHELNCEVPGRSTCVAEALAALGPMHLVIDARFASAELAVALHGTVSLLASQLTWWVAVHRPVDLPNHIACPETAPEVGDARVVNLDVAAWLPGSPRSATTVPEAFRLPDTERVLLRADLAERIRIESLRSPAALADGLIHTHAELFTLATGTPQGRVTPMDLFGLRFIAEAATDANVACLAAAAAARVRLQIGQFTEALERIDQAMSRTQYADPVHRALLMWAEALVQQTIGDESTSVARFEDALVIVHNARDLALLATLHRQWAESLAERGLSQKASQHFRMARGLYRQQGNGEGLCAALRGAADLAVVAKEVISAEALYDQAEMTTTTDIEQANRLLGQASLAITQREWERARLLLKRTARIGIDHPLVLGSLHRRLADVALRSQDCVNAREEAELARGFYERAGRPTAVARCLRLMGDAEALQGHVQDAIKLYRRAAHVHIRTGDWVGMHRTIAHARVLCDGEPSARLGRLSTELMMFGSLQ